MPDSYYDDSSPSAPSTLTDDSSGNKSEASDSTDNSTALLPKDFFGSKELKVGKQCKVEIEKVYDDEIMVRYVPHKSGDTESASEDAAPGDKGEDDVYSDN